MDAGVVGAEGIKLGGAERTLGLGIGFLSAWLHMSLSLDCARAVTLRAAEVS